MEDNKSNRALGLAGKAVAGTARLTQSLGEKGASGLGVVVNRAAALPGEISEDISMPIINGAVVKAASLATSFVGKSYEMITGGGKKIVDVVKGLVKVEDKTDEVIENTEETNETLTAMRDIMIASDRAAREAARENGDTPGLADDDGLDGLEEDKKMGLLGWLATLAGLAGLIGFDNLSKFFTPIFELLTEKIVEAIKEQFSNFGENVSPALRAIELATTNAIAKMATASAAAIKNAAGRGGPRPPAKSTWLRSTVEAGSNNFMRRKFFAPRVFAPGVTPINAAVANAPASGLARAATRIVEGAGRIRSALPSMPQSVKNLAKRVPFLSSALETFFLKGDFDKIEAARSGGAISSEDATDMKITKGVASAASLAGVAAGSNIGGGIGALPPIAAVTGGLSIPIGYLVGGMLGGFLARIGAEDLVSDALGIPSDAFQKVEHLNSDAAPGAAAPIIINTDNSSTDQSSVMTSGSDALAVATGPAGEVQSAA